MNTEPITNRCPKCQAPLPANAPRGLCPKCLLAAASTPTEAGQPTDESPPPPLDAVAAAFPQLEILEVIGQGGMGVVYKTRQPHLDRFVALKVLSQSLAADATFAERFNREARVLARLNHPNIVTVHDFGQSGGFFYLLMEFVDGVNLRQAMQAGRFTPQQAMMLVPKICEALQFAHDEGILHRDIKPANILLDTRGRVKIADFGIAKLLGKAREKVTLTASGMAVGTPHYMAPEQLEHPQDVDQRADIYSLGVVFYEMLTGELPIGRFAPPSQKSAVDVSVDEVVFHALEREREKRCTGTVPHASDTGAVSVSAEPAWNRKTLPLIFACLLVCVAELVLVERLVTGPIWIAVLLVVILLVIVLSWFAVGFLRANSALRHGELDAVTSNDPPAPEPTSAGGGFGFDRRARARWLNASYIGMAAAAVLAILLTVLWGLGNRRLFSSWSSLAGPAAASQGQFVLYTMPTTVPADKSAPVNELRWNFKCLIPPNTFARVLFVRWTNGVPIVENGLSAYFKVGKASVDEDFNLSCERLGKDALTGISNAPAEQPPLSEDTSGVQWNVSLLGHVTYASRFAGEPAYRHLETPGILNVRSGHQGILRLVDAASAEGQLKHGQSGVELRIFLEPMKEAPIRTTPFEVIRPDYVAGTGSGWTADEAFKAIKQWPADK
jgi:tRNA A-37 threonylcarbamoyl transferase component Bud32